MHAHEHTGVPTHPRTHEIYSRRGPQHGWVAEQVEVDRTWHVKLREVQVAYVALEGGGASIKGVSGTKGRSGYDFTAPSVLNIAAMEALSSVPVVCAALGPVAGFPAARLVASPAAQLLREPTLGKWR